MNNSVKSSNETRKMGSTEIISKYNNYNITKIVTDLSNNEVTEISKITKETLEDIIGGYLCQKRQKLSENVKYESLQNQAENCNSDKPLLDSRDSSKVLCDIEIPTVNTSNELLNNHIKTCYVRLEYNQIIENQQKNFINVSKTQEQERKPMIIFSNHNNTEEAWHKLETEDIKVPILSQQEKISISSSVKDLENPVDNIECASSTQICSPIKTEKTYSKNCYVKMKMDPAIEIMQNKLEQISETQFKNKDNSKYCDEKCDQYKEKKDLNKTFRKRKKSREYNIDKKISSLNSSNKRYGDENVNIKSNSVLPNSICTSSLSQEAIRTVLTEMCHYERENNILIYENLRIENVLIKAINKIKFLERELDSLKRFNNYKFLKKYFKENEITAILENTIIDWNNNMITKAMQLRFACGNEGYEELSKDLNLPSLKILRNKVHDSQFDMALLAKDMINF